MIAMKTRLASVAAIAVAAAVYATPASAQATRTWVSGVGDDVNPCSRTAPCKTFAGAISKTAAGGEINCLDPAGYGAVTITKSLTIDCHYTEGGALAGGNGIVVNLPATTDSVLLRGLDIFGVNPPSNGIRMIGLGTLHVEDCVVRRFNAASSNGISFQPSGAAEMFVYNTLIAENGNGGTGGGILIQPTGAGGTAHVLLDNVRVNDNANNGLLVNTTGDTNVNGITVVVTNSSFSGNATGISVLNVAATTTAVVTVLDSTLTGNSTIALTASGASAFVRVGNTTITGNQAGVSALLGSTINTYGNNRNISNPSVGGGNEGLFTGSALPTQ
ncbi:MAG: hypothetical protein QOJ27_2094 [Sphingomonadales bacterium]|nr:hypothetical protein [Sphingomonadales bacterium]